MSNDPDLIYRLEDCPTCKGLAEVYDPDDYWVNDWGWAPCPEPGCVDGEVEVPR